MKLSIVIPTLGRPSLKAALDSCRDADEIVVVLDTSRGGKIPCELPENAILLQGRFGVTGGHAGRLHGMQNATGTHLAFFDDDDIYAPGAIEIMRTAAEDVPTIFRMDHYSLGILWREPRIEFGNVSTQMYVVPNRPEMFGAWTPVAPHLPQPGGDYTFIKETCEKMGGPVWREEIIAILRPSSPSISVVTPWHNHPELLADYANATSALRTTDELIVVDNGSNEPIGPHWVFENNIRLDQNTGFSHASNVGLFAAKSESVLFLNNDVYARDPEWLEKIRKELEPGVLVGTKLRFDAHGDVGGHRLPYLDGWCLAGMREDLLKLGGFDETYEEPAYYSDNDLCFRARLEGMTLREVRCGIYHKGGATSEANGYVLPSTAVNREKYTRMVNEALGVTISG